MSTEVTHPHRLQIARCEKPNGHFQWLNRERGKLRNRPHRSEREPPERSRAELERATPGRDDERRF